jgi:hypothetical protein
MLMSSSEIEKTLDITAAMGLEFEAQRQGRDCVHLIHYQIAKADPTELEAYCYTDKISYLPGEEVAIHASSTGGRVDITIIRDGVQPRQVAKFEQVAADSVPTPEDFYSRGCGWPVIQCWRIPQDAPSGFYIIRIRAQVSASVVEHEHGVCVRRAGPGTKGRLLFILSTCTWTAYNDWGGCNNYLAVKPPEGFHFAPRLSLQRPFARGLIWLPSGAPRITHDARPRMGDTPRYPSYEWAYAKGFSKLYACAGWATYERNFAVWAEQQGFELDYITQHDLDRDPQILMGYRCTVMVGHCEYWSARMRDAIDGWVETGGHVARFAGNFMWQIRLEDEGNMQVCYKELATAADPLFDTADTHLTTGMWEDPRIGRPGSSTFGLQSSYGIYARFGTAVPRGSGGFIVYRPDHWAFAKADLYYGDTFGDEANIFGFELDGLEYEFRDGLPFPKEPNSLPEGLEILAMNVVSAVEADHGHPSTRLFLGDSFARGIASVRYGDTSSGRLDAARRGSGMVVAFKKGRGEVLHAGSSEWVNGLRLREPFTERITSTVLRRFMALDD